MRPKKRFSEAEETLQLAAKRGLDIDEFIMLDYDLAFLKGDQVEMQREAGRARARSAAEGWISNHEAFTLAYFGHLNQSRSIAKRAIDQAEHAGQRERATLFQAAAAVREAWYGKASEARTRATAALEGSKDREVEYGVALALALIGDNGKAESLADNLQKRFPENTSVRFTYVPAIRARVALNHGNAEKAIDLLQAAVPVEFGCPLSCVSGLFGALYPVYVRGQAYLALRRAGEAAAEFQKILDHRGIVAADPMGALARLQLVSKSIRYGRRQRQGANCLSGFPRSLATCRSRHSDPQASQSRIHEAAVSAIIPVCKHETVPVSLRGKFRNWTTFRNRDDQITISRFYSAS